MLRKSVLHTVWKYLSIVIDTIFHTARSTLAGQHIPLSRLWYLEMNNRGADTRLREVTMPLSITTEFQPCRHHHYRGSKHHANNTTTGIPTTRSISPLQGFQPPCQCHHHHRNSNHLSAKTRPPKTAASALQKRKRHCSPAPKPYILSELSPVDDRDTMRSVIDIRSKL